VVATTDELKSVRAEMERQAQLRTGQARLNLMRTLKRVRDNAGSVARAINAVQESGTTANLAALSAALGS